MPGSRVSLTGGTLAATNSTIGGLPRGEVRLQQRQIVRVIPIDDRATRGLPHALVRQDVLERGADRAQPVRLADPIRMQRDAHHAALFGTFGINGVETVSYTHLRAHETRHDLVCRLLLEKKKK